MFNTEITNEEIIRSIWKKSPKELAELIERLNEFDQQFSAADLPVMAPAGAARACDDGMFQEPLHDVWLNAPGPHKISAIREVRMFTALGLKEAKALVDNAPSLIKKQISLQSAKEMLAAFDKIGADAEIR
mgnify:CR=1 FL=1